MCRQIRQATVGDIDQIAGLYDVLNDYLAAGTNYPGWRKDIYPTRKDAEAGLLEGNLYVVTENDRIAGTVILSHHPEPAYNSAKWLIECDYSQIIVIHTLAVHPDFLSKGVGKYIMDFALHHAGAAGMSSVRLDVYEKNMPAIRLYEQSGFTYIDTVDLGYSQYGLHNYRLYERLVP